MGARNTWIAAAALSLGAHALVLVLMPSDRRSEVLGLALVALRVEAPAALRFAPNPTAEHGGGGGEPAGPPTPKKKVEPSPAVKAEPREAAMKAEPVAAELPAANVDPRGEGPAATSAPTVGEAGDAGVGEAASGAVASGGSGGPAPTGGAGGRGRGGGGEGEAKATRDLAGYQRGVYGAVNAKKRYPAAARRLGIEGRVVVAVTLDHAGQVLAKRVVTSSQQELLDEEALRMVDAAAPYPPLPPTWSPATAELTLPVRFSLE